MKKLSQHAIRPATKIIQMRRDIEHKYPSYTPGGVQASASQPLNPHWKASLILFSRRDVVCLCIHWMVQNTKQHRFLIHAGGVYTTCVPLPFTSFPGILMFFIGVCPSATSKKKHRQFLRLLWCLLPENASPNRLSCACWEVCCRGKRVWW